MSSKKIQVNMVTAGAPNTPQEIYINYGNYYRPTISADGIVTWEFVEGTLGGVGGITPVSIKSPSIKVLGSVVALGNLPAGASKGDCYGVGATQPFDYYVYNGSAWQNHGKLLSALTIGTVTMGEATSATITGEPPLQYLNLVLEKGDKGDTGDAGVYIGTVAPTNQYVKVWIDTSGGTTVLKIKDGDGNWVGIQSIKGADGRGIVSNVRTSGNGAAGTVDTYTITYTDGTTNTYTITNGAGGDMMKSVYDPTSKNADAFSMGNMAETSTAKIMTDTERTKLTNIADNANNYTHPANHSPSIITQDANNRFVTDTEKTTWNGKQTAILTTGLLKGTGSEVTAAIARTDYATLGLFVRDLSLPISGYSGTGPYTIDIAVTGVLTDVDRQYTIVPVWSTAADTRALEKTSWNLIDNYTISAINTLTLTLTAVPITAVTFAVKEVV